MTDLVPTIMGFLNTANWDETQAYAEQHPVLLTEAAETAFEEMIRSAASVGDKQILYTHRAVLRRAREVGLPTAFAELKASRRENPHLPLIPVELVEVVKHLGTLAPARLTAFLEGHPDIRAQLMDLGLIQVRQNTSLESVLLAFINANNWADKRRILEQNQMSLFSAGAVVWFEGELLKAKGHSVNTLVLQAHQKLLTRCQEIGIPEAFAEAETALQNVTNN